MVVSGRSSLALWWRGLVWRPWRHQPGSYAAMIAVVAIGVAMTLAIELINGSALESFRETAARLSGRTDVELVARSGSLGDADLARIRRHPLVAAAYPVLRGRLALRTDTGTEVVSLLAMDLLAERDFRPRERLPAPRVELTGAVFERGAVILGNELAKRLRLRTGDEFSAGVGGQQATLRMVGILDPGAVWQDGLLMDIATAQWTLDRIGELDRIDVRLRNGTDATQATRAFEQLLAPRVLAVLPQLDSRQAAIMSRAYRVNLRVLSLVGLLTAVFMVAALMELGLRRRKAEFAILRALGVTPWYVAGLMLATVVGVAVPAVVLGLLLGLGCAAVGIELSGGDLGAGYFAPTRVALDLPPATLLIAMAAGFGATLIAVLPSWWRFVRAAEATTLRRGAVEHRGGVAWFVVSAGLLAGLAAGATYLPAIAELPVGGYLAIAAVLGATLSLAPALVVGAARWLPAAPGWPTLSLVMAQLAAAPKRTAMAAGAVMVSFSLLVAMSSMVWSFRGSVERWLDQVLRADLFVTVEGDPTTNYLVDVQAREIAALPGIAGAEPVRDRPVVWPGGQADEPAVLLSARAFDNPAIRRLFGLPDKQGQSACVVSEAFVARFGVAKGDTLALPFESVAASCRIAAVWRDYGYQWGRVVIDQAQYRALTGDTRLSGLAITLAHGANLALVRQSLDKYFATRSAVRVADNATIRVDALAEFDRAFAVTYVLLFIAAAVGVFAVANALLVQGVERSVEFAMLRHLGWTPKDIVRALAVESLLVATLGVTLGTLSGAVNALILNQVVNWQSFHWSIDTEYPVGLIATVALAVVGASVLFGALIGGRLGQADPAVAVRND